LLYVARDRTEESLRGFFSTVPASSIESLRFICTDMWKFGDQLNQVRAEEARQMKPDGYEPVLKNSRWCLLKRREN